MQLLAQSALLRALGWSLFNSLWQMALLWLCYILLTAMFRRLSSHVRHGMAVLFLGLGTLAFIVTFSGSYMAAAAGRSLTGGWLHPIGAARPLINLLLPYASSIYLLTLIFLFARYAGQYRYSRRLRTDGLSRMQAGYRLFVRETAQLMGIGRKVEVWLSSLVDGPLTIGCLRPVILLPLAMVNNLSVAQVEAILLHELAHIKRFDYLLNLIVTVLEIIFFFNPFTRLMIRDIGREREHRCDDLVIQFRYDARLYVTALLSLAAANRSGQRLAMAATGRNDRLLLQRVRRILKQNPSADRPGAKPILFFLFAMMTAMIGLSGRVNPISRLVQRQKTQTFSVVSKAHRSSFEQSPVTYTIDNRQDATERKTTITHSRRHETSNGDDQTLEEGSDPDLYYVNDENGDSAAETLLKNASSASTTVRDYSIAIDPNMTLSTPDVAPLSGATMPYVPTSSFSYRVTDDTTAPLDQVSVLLESGGKATELKNSLLKAISVNQEDIERSTDAIGNASQALENLRSASSLCEQTNLNIRKQILREQIKTQRLKLRQLNELQRKLETAIARLRTVQI